MTMPPEDPTALPGNAPAPFAPVRSELEQVETLVHKQLAPDAPCLAEAARLTRATGGKRLRPAAFLLLVKALGRRPGVPHIVVAAVLELCHTASLLHDDVLDEAHMRRGRRTLNRARGNREAILFGDHILAGAFQLLADLARPELILLLADLVREVVAGEVKQWALRGPHLSRTEYLDVVRAKTAAFFRHAGIIAGRMASWDTAAVARLAHWGECFGIAYQIFDDIYDLAAPPRGDKSTGLDARHGLLTLPWILLRDAHGMPALRDLYLRARCAGGRSCPERDPRLKAALEAGVREAERFLAEGRAIIEDLPAGEARDALLALGRRRRKANPAI